MFDSHVFECNSLLPSKIRKVLPTLVFFVFYVSVVFQSGLEDSDKKGDSARRCCTMTDFFGLR